MQHGEHGTNDTFGSDFGWLSVRSGALGSVCPSRTSTTGTPSAIHYLLEPLEYFGATLEDPWTGSQRLYDTQTGETRLGILERQQRTSPARIPSRQEPSRS